MISAYLLHFYLHSPVLRIHIVKLLLSRLSGIRLDLRIKIFVHMHDLLHAEPQVIKRSPLPVGLHFPDRLTESCPSEHQHASEIKIIPQSSPLAVDQRMLPAHGFTVRSCNQFIMIGIKHIRARVFRNTDDAVQGKHAHFQRQTLRVEKHVFLRQGLSNAPESFCFPQGDS